MKSSSIKCLFDDLDPAHRRQLLLVYTRFLLDIHNRSQLLDPASPTSVVHESIIKRILSAPRAPKPSALHSIFDKLPTMLLSQCISFLDQSDRAAVCKTSLLMMKAASTSIAKQHLRINQSF